MIGTILFCIVLGLISILIKKWLSLKNYWKDRGVPYAEPIPFIGNVKDNFLKKKTLAEVIRDIGKEFNDHPLVGFYNMMKPSVICNHHEYAEIILIKEFSHFMNRNDDIRMKERRPLDKHLFFITGSEWKAVRSKLTPVFSTGKLKGMLPEIESIFDKTFKDINLEETNLDLKDIIEKCTLRVRAACVFGIDLSHSKSENDFTEKVNNMSDLTIFNIIPVTIALWFPRIAKIFNFSIFGVDNENFLVDVLLKSFNERTEKEVIKDDFVQIMLELKNKGKVEVQKWAQEDNFLKMDEKHVTTDTIEIDNDILVAQSFIFLIAGLETLINTLTMLLVELSRNPQVLKKLTQEIDSVIENNNKEFSFEALKNMEYLEVCIKETLRMHTPAEFLVRHCCKDFTFPNGVTVEKGTDIFFPSIKYLYDPAIFPEPTLFKPERFVEDSHPICAYLPFGQGPRICIGLRFAVLEMKMFVSKLIYNYELKLDLEKTELPIKTDKWYFLRKNVSPIHMKFKPRIH